MMLTLRVMTFNVRGAFPEDGENIWERRSDLNVHLLRETAPDLIGFQELQQENLDVYRRRLTDYLFQLGPRANRPDKIFYNAIFWRRDRFDLRDNGWFYLSRTPSQWSKDWDSGRVRAMTWVKLRCLESGIEFLHVNTHLDHIGIQARLESSRLIHRLMAAHTIPVILTGDFNSPPRMTAETAPSYPYEVFKKQGWDDAYSSAHPAAVGDHTFHGFQGEAYPAARSTRMDWILTRNGWTTRDCVIVRDARPPVFPSDHYPVLAELHLT